MLCSIAVCTSQVHKMVVFVGWGLGTTIPSIDLLRSYRRITDPIQPTKVSRKHAKNTKISKYKLMNTYHELIWNSNYMINIYVYIKYGYKVAIGRFSPVLYLYIYI